jgi:ATP-dependent Lon protease
MIICGFGTKNIEDLLFITFGSEFINLTHKDETMKQKFALIKKYVQPIGYKTIHWKNNKSTDSSQHNSLCSNKITDDILFIENANMFECFDAEKPIKSFFQKIYGIRVIIQNERTKKTLVINGIVDDIQLNCLDNLYIKQRFENIKSRSETLNSTEKDVYSRVIDALTIKDILILGDEDVYKKMISVFTETNIIKSNNLDITIRRFLEMDVYNQRNLLVNLLLNNSDFEVQYICYLLYDLLSIQSMDSGDAKEQVMIYDSLPWKIKTYFKDVIKHTIKNTNDMMQKYDINKISLEQQIYLLKADDVIKEKAMVKLKEVKTKSDEMGIKAKQYLEGLIKIPFGIYKEEPILKQMKEMNAMFSKITGVYEKISEVALPKKQSYTNTEIMRIINKYKTDLPAKTAQQIKTHIKICNAKTLSGIIQYINNVLKNEKKDRTKSRTKEKKLLDIENFLNSAKEQDVHYIYESLKIQPSVSLQKTTEEIVQLSERADGIEKDMKKITNTLDESIHGHAHAKNQILKIIAQWMNGEQKGYSFGFEGSPGIGKTSLAKKGLANCLKDEKNESRPYSFIALGGSSNGKTLEGHGYTYVNSTWGKIVDILMESKCMNPIIYIDELDKVSKTEEGKEIIGILIHLIDQTQNELFQDKYFSGINLDLSKALFIFSYNDPEQIDKILLDRIHRIKFDNLSLQDKLVIVKKYILPEMNAKMGFTDVIDIDDDIITYIIETYTCEPGVRKLKEILFDLYGEINIELLKCENVDLETPIIITKDLIQNKYLKKYKEINYAKIHNEPLVGVINGLWANSLGVGGILPIETMFFPSETFLDLKLTGLQGDVMKESMNVAKSLAWYLTDNETKKTWIKSFEETRCQGLHIHCAEGAVSKDGPSAGAAITTAIYSLLNNKKIKNDIAITGEINLQGKVTAIGGLSEKIRGAIKSGVKTILYPKENNKEFNNYKEQSKNELVVGLTFKEVERIEEILDIVFE